MSCKHWGDTEHYAGEYYEECGILDCKSGRCGQEGLEEGRQEVIAEAIGR